MNNKYYKLSYSHDQIEALLNMLSTQKLLDTDSYYKLMTVIDNISTFDGDYNSLTNKPNINVTVEDELFKLGFDAGTIDEIYRYVNNMSDNIKAHIDSQIAQSELSYAEKVELYTTAESLQAYVEQRITETIKPWLTRDYATRSEVMAKSDKGHLHGIDQISGLQPALDSKASVAHSHAGLYASADAIHYHNNRSALDKISEADINKWNLIDAFDLRLNDLEHEITEEAPDKYLNQDDLDNINTRLEIITDHQHSHSNQDVLNKITNNEITNWNNAQHSLGSEFNTGHWQMNKQTTASIGGIQEGVDLDGLQLSEIIARLLYPDKKPEIESISLITTPSGSTFEIGQSVMLNKIVVFVNKTSNPIAKVEFYVNNVLMKLLIDDECADGGEFEAEINQEITDSINNSYCRVVVTDTKDMSVSSNTHAINFYCPYYYGVVEEAITVDQITEDMIKAMTKKVAAKGAQTCTYNTQSQRMVFACPVSQGAVVSILDGSGFENMNAFSRATISVVGITGQAQDYYVYANDATTNTNFKMTFKFE